jgi:septal ring factor EnvC (AmiA/AmiB activator)
LDARGKVRKKRMAEYAAKPARMAEDEKEAEELRDTLKKIQDQIAKVEHRIAKDKASEPGDKRQNQIDLANLKVDKPAMKKVAKGLKREVSMEYSGKS